MAAADPYLPLDMRTRVAFTPHVYEIHGNVKYMRCSDSEQYHSRVLKASPTLEQLEAEGMPRCQECNAPMKPHALFFDEAYNEKHFRQDSVMKYVN